MTETPDAHTASRPENLRSTKRRIFVVEDHEFMRRTMVTALEREANLTVCGVADDIPNALVAIARLRPDLVVTDLALKTTSGLDLIQTLHERAPSLPVVATTMFAVQSNERRARAAGARGFASKQSGPEALVDAVHAALRGAAGTGVQ